MNEDIRIFKHFFTTEELDYLIMTLSADADAGSELICSQILGSLKQTRREGPMRGAR